MVRWVCFHHNHINRAFTLMVVNLILLTSVYEYIFLSNAEPVQSKLSQYQCQVTSLSRHLIKTLYIYIYVPLTHRLPRWPG